MRRWRWCAARTLSWPTWPRRPPRRPNGCWPTPTRSGITGVTPDGATRRVSLHDPDARPIAKGRLGKPVEFAHKAQICDNDDGIVLDHNVELGNPPDAPQLAPAIDRIIKQTGRMPRVVTADRGYGEAGIDRQLLDRGVGNVVIPARASPARHVEKSNTAERSAVM